MKNNGSVISAKNVKLFQTKNRFLGHDLYQGTYNPISRTIEFFDRFPNVILDKTQLQIPVGSINYVADFIPKVRHICKPLFDRLKKTRLLGVTITPMHLSYSTLVKHLPYLGISNP